MTYDEIMKSITQGLTGDFETDKDYLEEQIEKYKNHELGKEIIRACSRILYRILPEDMKEEFIKEIQKEELSVESILEEIQFNVHTKYYKKANILMKSLAEKIENLEKEGVFQDDAVSMYFNFNNPFEEILYRFRNEPKKNIRLSGIPFAETYLQYGSLLFAMERYEEAREILEKAMRWNPCSARIAFEYAETFKVVGDLETFFKVSVETFKIAYTQESVARCYRNLAFYFVEKELWSVAMVCNIMSLQYEPDSKNAISEIYYIEQKTNGSVPKPKVEEFDSYGEKYGFPIGADEDILGIAYSYGKYFLELEEDEHGAAKFFFTIFYDLTEDKEIKEIIDKLS